VFFVTRGLPFFLELGLLVFCLIDVVQTPPQDCRNLGKVWWIVLIIIVPLVGAIAWLVAGRPERRRGNVPWPSRTAGYPEWERPRTAAPDDDPEFLAQLNKVDKEQKATLSQWEADLRRREEDLRRHQGETAKDPKGPDHSSDTDHTSDTDHPNDPGDEGWVEKKQP